MNPLEKLNAAHIANQAAQSETKSEAIANADAHTNNAGLPTYSALVVTLTKARRFVKFQAQEIGTKQLQDLMVEIDAALAAATA